MEQSELTLAQAARRLGITTGRVSRLLHAGRLPGAYKVQQATGRWHFEWRIPAAAVDQYAAERDAKRPTARRSQVNMRLSERARQNLTELARAYGSVTAAAEVAVEHLHREVKKQRAELQEG